MPKVNNNIRMASEKLAEKVSALGSNTIMGDMQSFGNDYKDKVEKLQDAIAESKENSSEVTENAITGNNFDTLLANAGYVKKTRPVVRDNKKIGRNDHCPCGSGRKYKNCCMNTGKYETTHYV